MMVYPFFCKLGLRGMLHVNLKDRIQIYQLVAALTVVTLILLGCLIILTPFFPAMLLSTIFTPPMFSARWLPARPPPATKCRASCS